MSFVLLGILNSQAAGAGAAGAYELIETIEVSSQVSSVTFSSINTSAYNNLQLRTSARSTDPSGNDRLSMRINGDTGTNYAYHRIEANGAVSTGGSSSQSLIELPTMANQNDPSSFFGVSVVEILNAGNSSVATTTNSIGGGYTPDLTVDYYSGLWTNTSAVSSITLLSRGFDNFMQYSRFSLYGQRIG